MSEAASRQRRIAPGELLAIDAAALVRADGVFIMFGQDIKPNARLRSAQDVACVYVRGSLDHHAGGALDSYEAIADRIERAALGTDGEGGADQGPPSAVLVSIDSRGGVVSGLNEHVAKIQKIRQRTGVPILAWIDEMAASAAYALACACDEIVCPASAVLGSIGTISTMISTVAADKAMGVDVRLITSGARKSDGHPHAEITDAAEEAERGRVEAMADAFFKLAGKSRRLAPEKLRALQAAIFLGTEAKKKGLADAVMSLEDVALGLTKKRSEGPAAKGNETDRRAALDTMAQRVAHVQAQRGPLQEVDMGVALAALIAKTEAAVATAADPKKKARLEADLAAYRLTAIRAEGGDDDGDDDEDEDDDKKAKAAAKAEKSRKMAEAAKHKAKADEHRAKAAEYDEAARKCAEDDGEESKAALAARAGLSPGAAAAIASQAAMGGDAMARLDALERDRAEEKRTAMIESAVAGRRITKHEAKTLAAKPLTFVKDYLSMRPKALVPVNEDDLVLPNDGADRDPNATTSAELAEINERISLMGVTDPKQAEKLRGDMVANRRKLTNGVARF